MSRYEYTGTSLRLFRRLALILIAVDRFTAAAVHRDAILLSFRVTLERARPPQLSTSLLAADPSTAQQVLRHSDSRGSTSLAADDTWATSWI